MYYRRVQTEKPDLLTQSGEIFNYVLMIGTIHAIDKAALSNIVIPKKTEVLIKTVPQLP